MREDTFRIRSRKSKALLVGSTGRVGRLVSSAFANSSDTELHVVRQTRGSGVGHETSCDDHLIWNPASGTSALLSWCSDAGPVESMIVLAGAPPNRGLPMEANTWIAEQCLEGALQAGIRRVLLASSSAVYGSGSGQPISEDAELAPVNGYGIAKRAMEAAVAHYRDAGLDLCCLRIGNVLGADALMLNAAKASRHSPVLIDRFSSGSGPVRSYIDPITLARVLEVLSSYPASLPKVLNIACPSPLSMDAIAEAAGLEWGWRDASDSGLERIVLDCQMISRIYHFTADDCDAVNMIARFRKLRV